MSSWLWQRGMGRPCSSHLSRTARGDGGILRPLQSGHDESGLCMDWGSHAGSFDGSASGQERQIL